MVWNNAFLKFDQEGFQQMVFVGVKKINILRFIKWLIFLGFQLQCMTSIYQELLLFKMLMGTIWSTLPE